MYLHQAVLNLTKSHRVVLLFCFTVFNGEVEVISTSRTAIWFTIQVLQVCLLEPLFFLSLALTTPLLQSMWPDLASPGSTSKADHAWVTGCNSLQDQCWQRAGSSCCYCRSLPLVQVQLQLGLRLMWTLGLIRDWCSLLCCC